MNNECSPKIKRILEEGKKCQDRIGIIGPTGPQGPATIQVGTTTTTDPGTQASVTNAGTNENVILNFTIPQGPTGPQGTSVQSVYGSKYDSNANVIAVTANNNKEIPLTNTTPLLGINGDTANTLTIEQTGIYKIDYYFQGSSSVAATVIVEVLKNGNTISNSSIEKDLDANESQSYNGSIITSLDANDKITLAINSSLDAQITPAESINSYLIIVKLS